MPEEIQTRLKETSAACDEAYVAWIADKKSISAQQSLAEAVHELRKVASRLEIDLAVVETNHARSLRPVSSDDDFQDDGGQPKRGRSGGGGRGRSGGGRGRSGGSKAANGNN